MPCHHAPQKITPMPIPPTHHALGLAVQSALPCYANGPARSMRGMRRVPCAMHPPRNSWIIAARLTLPSACAHILPCSSMPPDLLLNHLLVSLGTTHPPPSHPLATTTNQPPIR
jgi:hypothetical protein